MKILLTGDWHFDAVTAGVRRVDEFNSILDGMVRTIEDQAVDHVMLLGDYFDVGGMRAHELTSVLFDSVHSLCRSRVKSVVMIAGNHDVVESSEGWTTISPIASVASAFEKLWVFERPRTVHHSPGLSVLALPYTARSVAQVSDRYLDQAYKLSRSTALVVIGHMTVPGAALGNESKEFSRGKDVDLPIRTIAELRPALVANGHYHASQVVKGPGGVEVLIPGSLMRLTFDDDSKKGFMIVEV